MAKFCELKMSATLDKPLIPKPFYCFSYRCVTKLVIIFMVSSANLALLLLVHEFLLFASSFAVFGHAIDSRM